MEFAEILLNNLLQSLKSLGHLLPVPRLLKLMGPWEQNILIYLAHCLVLTESGCSQACLFSADNAFGTDSEEKMVSFCPFSILGVGKILILIWIGTESRDFPRNHFPGNG